MLPVNQTQNWAVLTTWLMPLKPKIHRSPITLSEDDDQSLLQF